MFMDWSDYMSKTQIFKELYKQCKEMDIEDTMELVLNADSKEEQDFIELVSDYLLQQKQKEVIAQGKF